MRERGGGGYHLVALFALDLCEALVAPNGVRSDVDSKKTDIKPALLQQVLRLKEHAHGNQHDRTIIVPTPDELREYFNDKWWRESTKVTFRDAHMRLREREAHRKHKDEQSNKDDAQVEGGGVLLH